MKTFHKSLISSPKSIKNLPVLNITTWFFYGFDCQGLICPNSVELLK
jgi:hypothetical protein